ncbi:autotransporter assembly complex protein TamA [Tepidicaulis sp. LMO-SS28]|uniref:autotransporter assembly complex protein TamA n=1 Tax=Tepidicaulis sp. LMO-SS28 TaxID=3447455 RepID=UPI003EE3DACB
MLKKLCPGAAAALLALALAGCASGGVLDRVFGNGEGEGLGGEPVFSTAGGISYDTELTGVEKDGLAELLEDSSELIALEDRLPASLGALRRRAEGDLERLQTALRSEGYYDGEVRYMLQREKTPVLVTLEVAPGPRYMLAEYKVQYEGAPPPSNPPTLSELGIKEEMPARAPEIVAAQAGLLRLLARRGHPLAKVIDRRAVVDHDTGKMEVTLRVNAGAFSRFGKAELSGNESVEEDYARDLIAWEEGEVYDEEKVEETRRAYAQTGLFGGIGISHGGETNAGGELPMEIDLSETAPRSIGFGAKYSTSEGPGGNASWEHRNLFGRNEQLRLDLTVTELEQVLSGQFTKPRFLRADQELIIESELANRNTDAFDEQGLSAGIAINRDWLENWEISAGLSAEYTKLKDESGESTFQLFGVPLSASRDSTDNALDPSRGSRLSFVVVPYAGMKSSEPLAFVKTTVTGSAYYAVDEEKRYILAGLVRAGSIAGEETPSVPANKRYFAGGGGSIRGYEYQKVGPLDDEGEPLGGRSLFEVKGELRTKVTENFGLVPFVDGGMVFDNEYPDFQEDLQWAGGLGFRYFTGFGPLRADIAIPINKRQGDDDFQFYISIGQAF